MYSRAASQWWQLLGKGSEFITTLPLLVQVAARQPGKSQNRQNASLTNKDAALSLAMLLRLKMHEIQVAHDGLSALELANTFHPEAVFIDIGMPGMDGYEVTRRLSVLPGLENVVLAVPDRMGSTRRSASHQSRRLRSSSGQAA